MGRHITVMPRLALPVDCCRLTLLMTVEKSNFSASDLRLKQAYLTREGIVLIQADQEPESNFYGKKVCFNRQILKANSQIA